MKLIEVQLIAITMLESLLVKKCPFIANFQPFDIV
jgi:hypothetical protein